MLERRGTSDCCFRPKKKMGRSLSFIDRRIRTNAISVKNASSRLWYPVLVPLVVLFSSIYIFHGIQDMVTTTRRQPKQIKKSGKPAKREFYDDSVPLLLPPSAPPPPPPMGMGMASPPPLGTRRAISPIIRCGGCPCSHTVPGPVKVVTKRPSPPNIAFLIPCII